VKIFIANIDSDPDISFEKAHLLQLKEKALIEKTNSELIWLKQMKKRIQSKGDDEKMPLILKKQQEITQRFKREQVSGTGPIATC
jgi:hypothetical protein